MTTRVTDDDDGFPGGLEWHRGMLRDILHQADAANGRRRQDRLAIRLVVERDVAGDDREIQGPTGLANATHGHDELAHDLGLLRIAEIEVVGDRQRQRTNGRNVAPHFRHGLLAAEERICLHIARGHVALHGDGLVGPVDAHDGGIATRLLHRVAHDRGIILLIDPAAAREIRRGNKLREIA